MPLDVRNPLDRLNNLSMIIQECDARGCSRKGYLGVFYGQFCKYHARDLEKIRRRIKRAQKDGLVHLEIRAREAELDFRKFSDWGHIRRIQKLKAINQKCFAGEKKPWKS